MQQVDTPEVSENCCLTQDGDCNLTTCENWNLKGHLQPTVNQNFLPKSLSVCGALSKQLNPDFTD